MAHLSSEVTGAKGAGDAQRSCQWRLGGGSLLWPVGEVAVGGQHGPAVHTGSSTSIRIGGSRGTRCHLLAAKTKKKSQRPDIFQIAFSNSKKLKKKNNNKEKDFTSSVFFFFPFRNKPRNPPLFFSCSLRGGSEKCGRRQKESRGQKKRCGSRFVTECATLWQRRRDDLRRRGSCLTKRTTPISEQSSNILRTIEN